MYLWLVLFVVRPRVVSRGAGRRKGRNGTRKNVCVPGRPFFILKCVIRPTPQRVSPTNSLLFLLSLSLSLPFSPLIYSFARLAVSLVRVYTHRRFTVSLSSIHAPHASRNTHPRNTHSRAYTHTQAHRSPRLLADPYHVYACTFTLGYYVRQYILHLYLLVLTLGVN